MNLLECIVTKLITEPISRPEPIEPKISFIDDKTKYKGELTVRELSTSAITTLKNQGKNITQTKEGYLIKY